MNHSQRILNRKTRSMCEDYSEYSYRKMRKYLKFTWLRTRLERGW